MKRESYKRRVLTHMIEMFEELNTIPHETRKQWGKFGYWDNYDPYIAEIKKEIERLNGNLRSVTQVNKEV
jgi:hypothetical protein